MCDTNSHLDGYENFKEESEESFNLWQEKKLTLKDHYEKMKENGELDRLFPMFTYEWKKDKKVFIDWYYSNPLRRSDEGNII